MKYTFDLECPRCHRDSTLTLGGLDKKPDPPPVVNCGECLWSDTEVVELTIVRCTVEAA